jgi:integrase/recombinase XerD
MSDNHPLTRYVQMYFKDHLICKRNMSRCTILSYRDAIKLFLQFASKRAKKPIIKLKLTDITEQIVLDFLSYIETVRGNSVQTRNHRLTILRQFFTFVSLQDPFLSEYCRRIVDIPSKRGALLPEITYLEKDELQAIFDVIDTRTQLGKRDYALLLFMYNTGARVQETAGLRSSWISFEEPYLVEIIGKGRKRRRCPIWETTAQLLKQVIVDRDGLVGTDAHVFLNRSGQPLGRFGISNIIGKYCIKAASAMPSLKTKTVTPHTIRHTTAMHLLKSGVEINVIRSWLGHAYLKTTHRYVEIDLALKQEALKSCELGNARSKIPSWQASPGILAWLESL